MKGIKKLGFAGILVGGLMVGGCGNSKMPIDLPNNYQTLGSSEKSIKHKGSTNIFSNELDLEEKSRIDGVISYIGFAKNEDTSISINNINQDARTRGLISGNAQNMTTIYDNMGVIVKVRTSKQEYIFSLKTQGNLLPPSIILEKYKKGDMISIPTIRKYKMIMTGSFPFGGASNGYRILNEIDYIYLNEIRKAN